MTEQLGIGGLTPEDPRFAAAVDLIGRTGAEEFQIRHSPDERWRR